MERGVRFGDYRRAATSSSADTPMSRAILRSNMGEISRPLWKGTVVPPAVHMAKLFVRAALPHLDETQRLQTCYYFVRLQHRQLGHD